MKVRVRKTRIPGTSNRNIVFCGCIILINRSKSRKKDNLVHGAKRKILADIHVPGNSETTMKESVEILLFFHLFRNISTGRWRRRTQEKPSKCQKITD